MVYGVLPAKKSNFTNNSAIRVNPGNADVRGGLIYRSCSSLSLPEFFSGYLHQYFIFRRGLGVVLETIVLAYFVPLVYYT